MNTLGSFSIVVYKRGSFPDFLSLFLFKNRDDNYFVLGSGFIVFTESILYLRVLS